MLTLSVGVVVWSGENVKVKCGCCSMEWGECYSIVNLFVYIALKASF